MLIMLDLVGKALLFEGKKNPSSKKHSAERANSLNNLIFIKSTIQNTTWLVDEATGANGSGMSITIRVTVINVRL